VPLDHVARRAVDCVVVGTQGDTGIVQHLLGSTTETAVRLATVPVAVRAPVTEASAVE